MLFTYCYCTFYKAYVTCDACVSQLSVTTMVIALAVAGLYLLIVKTASSNMVLYFAVVLKYIFTLFFQIEPLLIVISCFVRAEAITWQDCGCCRCHRL